MVVKPFTKINFTFSTSVQMPIAFNAKEVVSLKIFHFALFVCDLSFYCYFGDYYFRNFFNFIE